MMICGSAGFLEFYSSELLPLTAIAAVTTGIIIAIVYIVANIIANPRLQVWSKDEIVQLVISIAFALFVPSIVNFGCTVSASELKALFIGSGGGEPLNLYEAAEDYVLSAAKYAHQAWAAVRYHLSAYAIFSATSINECISPLGCLFGYSGYFFPIFGGYATPQAALSPFLQISMIATVTALMHYFILQLSNSVFILLLLPLAVFIRSLPYMRLMGATLFALSLSFVFIYPMILSIAWVGKEQILSYPDDYPAALYIEKEKVFEESAGTGASSSAAWEGFLGTEQGREAIKESYFDDVGVKEDIKGTVDFAVRALFGAVIVPTTALLAAIASTVYITRFFGQAVDLSRLMQLV